MSGGLYVILARAHKHVRSSPVRRAKNAQGRSGTVTFVCTPQIGVAIRGSLSSLGPFRERMSKPNPRVGRLSQIEMSGRGRVRAGSEPSLNAVLLVGLVIGLGMHMGSG